MREDQITIKALGAYDFKAWLALWQAYLSFYQTHLPMSTTETTWHNIFDNTVPIYGFGAYRQGGGDEDKLVGFTHVVLHPNTWNTSDCCYLEDLFVDEAARGLGVGRALTDHVYEFAKFKGCNRVYWTTQEGNAPARKLYDSLANKTDMVQYRKDL